MAPRTLFSAALFICFFPLLQAQESKPQMDRSTAKFELKPVAMQALAPAAHHIPGASNPGWGFSITNVKGIQHPGSADKEAIKALKQQKLVQKLQDAGPDPEDGQDGVLADAPILFREFPCNNYDGWYPPDNTMAISDNGFIVSSVNSNLSFYNENGTELLNEALGDYFSFLNLGSDFFYDPRVLFDADQNKFILVVLHGNTPADSKVVVSFSETQNPMDGWWSYVFDGNFLNNNTWFDFPSIGVSNEDLFISGNLFNTNDQFNQAVILQIDKQPGFAGGNIDWEYFNNVTDGFGDQAFTVAPMSYGFDGGYGPGIYLVSTLSGGGGYAHLYDITGNVEDDQDIVAYEIGTASYSPSADAEQQLTTKLLDMGDCRVASGFYANGLIHYVHLTDFGGGYGAVRYNRLDVQNESITYVNYGQNLFDYGYPSVAPIGSTNTEKSVIIGFLRASKSSFPEFRAASVDEGMTASTSTTVRQGEYFINVTADNVQRWGDYSGISRKHNSPNPVVWVSGCYGNTNSAYGNWIGELSLDPNASVAEPGNVIESSVFPNPVRDVFTLDLELAAKSYIHVFLSDSGGRTVRSLYKGRAKGGSNRLSFNKDALAPGIYFLSILDESQNTIRQEKIVIVE
ncbi:MAG: T9SS type A sorting domain-containing protein [Saprospirales bacterium]|nr:T9SS type A sorting domain-containing protein [Saprospirales bacterium]